jgi:peptide/nickel transport system substrate-binding protein
MKHVLCGVVAAAVAAVPLAVVKAQPAGTLTVGLGAEATVMDPTRSSAGVDQYFFGQMFEQLLRTDPSLKQVNWLAESWKLTEEGGKPVVTVTLREGLTFHNGDPVTSEDLQYSMQRQGDPKLSRFSHLVASVEAFEIVDARTFRLRFKEGDGSFITGNLILYALPKRHIETVGEEAFQRAPVGTGPWKFVSRTVKEELRLEAFEGYWNKEFRPTVKNLVIKIIPEDLTRVAAYKTGAIDWIDAVPPAGAEEFGKMANTSTVTVVTGNNLFLNFGTHLPGSPFKDVRVRQAAAHAIDVDAIIKRVLFGQGERYTQVGKGSIGYDPELKPYPYDPRRARALLAEAGFPRGFDTPCYNLTTPREPNVKEMGEAMFAYLSSVGIRCQVRQLEYGAWINLGRRGRNGPPEMDGVISWMWSHGLPGDPGTPWAGHLHSFQAGKGWGSYSYTEDAEMDALVEQQRQMMDPVKREALLKEIARKKHEKVLGGLPTYRPMVTIAWRTDKVEYRPWPSPGFWRNFQQVGLKQ